MTTRPGQYVRDHYRVPAFIGRRVRLTYQGTHEGTITGFDGQYLIVKWDHEPQNVRYRPRVHPTWELEYL